MSKVITLNGVTPQIGSNAFYAEGSIIVGDIVAGDDCSFWFHSVIRGDVCSIRLGNKVNVQDGAVIHGTFNKFSTKIGNNVSIGHRAIVHGCEISDNVLVGMGAIIMDGCKIGSNSIIGAGSVVLQNTIVPENSIFAGNPAKFIKELDELNLKDNIIRIANDYLLYATWYK